MTKSTERTPAEMAELSRRAARSKRARKKAGLPPLNPVTKAKENPKSKALAIRAMCYACQGGAESYRPDAGWQWAIGNCRVFSCPLWPHRPYREKCGAATEGVYKGGYK